MNGSLNSEIDCQLVQSSCARSTTCVGNRPAVNGLATIRLTTHCLTTLCLALGLFGADSQIRAASVSLGASRDNTLFRYDPADASSALNSNGSGNFLAAGSTLQRNALRRGLLYFDLSSVPVGQVVVPGSLQLRLYVVEVPRRDPAPRPFWMTRVVDSPWGEGASQTTAGVSGAGSGAAAQLHDATWFHADYDPAAHAGQPFQSGGPGFWLAPGILGDAPFNAAAQLGTPLGWVPSQIGGVTFSGSGLEEDVNRWLGGDANLGWLVLGDETLTGNNESGVRSFGSREHANLDFRPRLIFETRAVPEPNAGVLVGLGLACLVRRIRQRDRSAAMCARPSFAD